MIKLIECPRDAMQGIKEFIPTDLKTDYINSLLQVGFDTIDFGSFVSPKAIPQLSDTRDVLKGLDLTHTNTKLLAIIGNHKGAQDALAFEEISYLGFPFSISNTFLKLNIKSSYQQALIDIEQINKLAQAKNKEMVVYISMAFGNPYGDSCCDDMLFEAVESLQGMGIKTINLADTVGMGKADDMGSTFYTLIHRYPDIEFGLHLHTNPESYFEKIDEAYNNGCRRFDSVIMGYGGCPMSGQQLIGNLGTELLLNYLTDKNIETNLNMAHFQLAQQKANSIFNQRK